jgi:hypothetical protein
MKITPGYARDLAGRFSAKTAREGAGVPRDFPRRNL